MPKSILFRAADEPNPEIWDRYVEAQAFEDGDVAAKLLEGWVSHPEAIPADARKTVEKPKKAPAE